MNTQLLTLLRTEIKPGVELEGLQPPMDNALTAAADVAYRLNIPSVITAGTDGEHMDGSLHYDGLAIDVRRGDWPEFKVESLAKAQVDLIKRRLGTDFYVELEDTHIHIEYDPKPEIT